MCAPSGGGEDSAPARLRLLDLFCGAGGASVGYHRAGFVVEGVDHVEHRNYPFTVHVADVLEVLTDCAFLSRFDAVHASPPCQAYSRAVHAKAGRPDLLPHVRALLQRAGAPFVIENVPGAPMRPDLEVCGCMFGLRLVRRRWFETAPPLFALRAPCHHDYTPLGVYGRGTPSWHKTKLGRTVTTDEQRAAMGAPWMTRAQLAEAVPPAYTEYVGTLLARHLAPKGAAR